MSQAGENGVGGPWSGRRDAWLLALLLLALSIVIPGGAEANGGTVRVSNQRSGPYDLTAFTDPTPVRVGVCDVSVAVAKAGSSELVQDAVVTVTVEPVGHDAAGGSYAATHALATNKLFYAAHVDLPAAGRWRVDVAVSSGLGEGSASFEVEAEAAGLLDNVGIVAAVALVPALLVLWFFSSRARRARGR